MTSRIDDIAEAHVERIAALDPVLATFTGIAGHDDELPDLSPDGYAAREQAVREALAQAHTVEPADEREQVARDAFVERLGLEVEMADAGIDRSAVNVIDSALHNLRGTFDLMPTDGEQAWRDIDARLAGVPTALAQWRATLEEEAGRGRVVARRQYAEVARQARNWAGREGGSGDLFAALVAGSGTEGGLRSDLERHAAGASEALVELADFLDREMAPRGREREAVGRDHYRLASRVFLGAEVDLEETYAWGWEELARIEDDMAVTSRRILPTATGAHAIDEAIAHLDADPSRRIEGKEAFVAWMQQLAEQAIDDLAEVHFDIPEQVRRIECRTAPTNDGAIYYTGPSEDFTRPGRMWWAVPDGVTSFSPWREVTTVYHEGVPGHHLQIAQTAVRADRLNRWQRLMCWVSGHGEGWALYAERLMDELGYLADPADRLGMLDAQSFRAARVIVDIGMHLELEIPPNPWNFHVGERWTPELGLAFMREHCRMDDAFIVFEVNRYLGWPGQAPSYKVGERIWHQARADAQQRQGSAFDLKTFHRQALDLGSIGLDPLRAALGRL